MRLIDEFVQKVLDETDSFSIILPPEINLIRYYHFIQGKIYPFLLPTIHILIP